MNDGVLDTRLRTATLGTHTEQGGKVTTYHDEIQAKAEALAEDAFWGSQDEGSLTSGITSLVTDEVERKTREASVTAGVTGTPIVTPNKEEK